MGALSSPGGADEAASLPAELSQFLAAEAALVAKGRLDAACRSRVYRITRGPVRAVALMLHGFTAGPWQFDELGPILADNGILGLAVRLVGHGATKAGPDGPIEDGSDLPRAREVARFVAWAEQAMGLAVALARKDGVPLHLLGVSAGGAMALDILQRDGADIARVALFAPLLRPKSPLLRAFVWTFGQLPLGDRLADWWPIGWRPSPPRPDGWRRPGHHRFALGNVQALFRYARAVKPQSGRPLAAPVQLFATEADDKVSYRACIELAESEPGRHGLVLFPEARQVPHAMLTAWENPDEGSRQEIFAATQEFLLQGRPTSRGREGH